MISYRLVVGLPSQTSRMYVGSPSQTSRPNNKQVISSSKFGYPHLTLKEGPKVKSDLIRDFQPMISHRLVSHPKPQGPIISELLV